MRSYLLLVAVLAIVPASAEDSDTTKKFVKFIEDYGRTYEPAEFGVRYQAFEASLKLISALNKANPQATFGINEFADRTEEERRAMRGSRRPLMRTAIPDAPKAPQGPSSVDWRTKGAVSPVKNQGQCGSCWAFSATEEIESMWFLAGHEMAILSPQQIVSCDKQDGGCNGGWPATAYDYVESAGGMDPASAYPYTSGAGQNGQCHFNASAEVPGLKVTGFSYAGRNDEAEMAAQMASTGPISVCVDASSWDMYTGGILTQCGQQVDHCVQAVGYGTSVDGTDYWLVRNSWGTSWGQDGYIQLSRGQDTCAIASNPTIVHVTDA